MIISDEAIFEALTRPCFRLKDEPTWKHADHHCDDCCKGLILTETGRRLAFLFLQQMGI